MQYSIRAKIMPKEIRPSTLRLGGRNPAGDEIGFTNYYMELNGDPFIAICGEFHYSRYPEAGWKAEINKMKASGINILATYIFWNHHEEIEGVYNWQGNRNLRKFIELCQHSGLYVILRIGPFCHGEVRNGGLPDWLFGRTFDVRSNDEGYLHYVRRLYAEIGREASGLMFKDGGPVVGIQLENELNAAAALWELTAKQGDEYLSGGSRGSEGVKHMRHLKEMAIEAGLEAPIYTSTGWGGAPVLEDEVLPLYGGYAYTPWSISAQDQLQQPTREYLFDSYHDEGVAGEFSPPYPKEKYPFACCEMGGGMQTWYLSRFQVEPESVSAMSLMKIAGGCNFIGYYMFHGGTNPVGRDGYMNESTTPRITYDFQAPIGEFGQIRDSNHQLRLLHYFLRAFGDRLASTSTVLPEGATGLTPENTDVLRYAIRTDGKSGFVFVNNYQDHVEMKEHSEVQFVLQLPEGDLVLPQSNSLTVRKNASFILPFQFDLSGLLLRYATAQPVTVTDSGEISTYFFAMLEGIDGEFVLAADGIGSIECDAGTVQLEDGSYCIVVPHDASAMIRIHRMDGSETRIYAMASEEAFKLWEVETRTARSEDESGVELVSATARGKSRRRLLFSGTPLVGTAEGLEFFSYGAHEFSFREYQHEVDEQEWLIEEKDCRISAQREGWFETCHIQIPAKEIKMEVNRIHDHKMLVSLDQGILDNVEDVLLKINYTGNVGYAFSEGRLFHDHFYNGALWEIGLSRFKEAIQGGEIVLETTPLREVVINVAQDAAMAVEQLFEGEQTAEFHQVSAEPVYRVAVTSRMKKL
ncbi:beta-galactosidase [Paenibacillus bouchesdurhonensis]|uniref:beta-galactosidase n=1 Tax=Paenibacillus bouchesdurhonensis TaxID=1870990 RepID=UPI000DA6233F|nr:beta-galactosidase [Paenibacillus bouchesdurhonensis]